MIQNRTEFLDKLSTMLHKSHKDLIEYEFMVETFDKLSEYREELPFYDEYEKILMLQYGIRLSRTFGINKQWNDVANSNDEEVEAQNKLEALGVYEHWDYIDYVLLNAGKELPEIPNVLYEPEEVSSLLRRQYCLVLEKLKKEHENILELAKTGVK